MTNNKQRYAAPQVVPSSTITTRCVEPLLLTLPSRTQFPKEMIGFGTKATYGFPEDSEYTLVSADFASQEIQIAAMYAQVEHGGYAGSDRLDKAVLIGDKADGTDLHSIVGKEATIKRTDAKTLNYAVSYGAGVKMCQDVVTNALPGEERHKGKALGKKAFEAFKGKKDKNGKFYGGLASNFFNYGYALSNSEDAQLPIFNQAFPPCINVANTQRTSSPSGLNYTIQAAAATNGMLSAYLVMIEEECNLAGIQARMAATIHDEVVYIVKKTDVVKFAKCFIKGHIGVWSLLSGRLGLKDFSVQRLAYDICMDVSSRLRKESNQKIDTPCLRYAVMGYQLFIDRNTGKLAKRTFNDDGSVNSETVI